MNQRVLCAVLGLVGLLGCEKPCKEGFQRYGVKCVRSPVDASVDSASVQDAGADSGKVSVELPDGGPNQPTLDSGPVDEVDPATDLDANSPDAGEPVKLCYLDKDGDGVGAGDQRPC